MKRGGKIAAGAGIALLAAGAASAYGAHLLYRLALDPKSDRSLVFGAKHNSIPGDDSRPQWRDRVAAFWAAHPPASRYRTAHDGLRLHALAFENPDATCGWAVVVHGYSSDAGQMGGQAMMLFEAGHSVLVPDCRGHGLSEGTYIGMGWHDRLDLAAWAYALAEDSPGVPIALYGVSMGGATVMMTAGETLPPEVYALVEDCGYTSAWDEFAYQLRALFGLPSFPLLHMASLMSRARAGYFLHQADAVGQLKKARLPMLFIHGLQDTFVPGAMLDTVFEACAAPVKEKIAVEGAGHGGSGSVLGQAYWDAVLGFLASHRPPRGG